MHFGSMDSENLRMTAYPICKVIIVNRRQRPFGGERKTIVENIVLVYARENL